jgi:hypothetical protein|tara:strand:- start:185 stop:466 length:282 start_codon:yes stop_codon:yes gene_type:complete
MIKSLEKRFTSQTFVRTFLKQTESGFIYEVTGDGKTWYEVFKLKLAPICLDFEKRTYSDTDFKVKYPKDNDFGIWAWCCNSLNKAEIRLYGFK